MTVIDITTPERILYLEAALKDIGFMTTEYSHWSVVAGGLCGAAICNTIGRDSPAGKHTSDIDIFNLNPRSTPCAAVETDTNPYNYRNLMKQLAQIAKAAGPSHPQFGFTTNDVISESNSISNTKLKLLVPGYRPYEFVPNIIDTTTESSCVASEDISQLHELACTLICSFDAPYAMAYYNLHTQKLYATKLALTVCATGRIEDPNFLVRHLLMTNYFGITGARASKSVETDSEHQVSPFHDTIDSTACTFAFWRLKRMALKGFVLPCAIEDTRIPSEIQCCCCRTCSKKKDEGLLPTIKISDYMPAASSLEEDRLERVLYFNTAPIPNEPALEFIKRYASAFIKTKPGDHVNPAYALGFMFHNNSGFHVVYIHLLCEDVCACGGGKKCEGIPKFHAEVETSRHFVPEWIMELEGFTFASTKKARTK